MSNSVLRSIAEASSRLRQRTFALLLVRGILGILLGLVLFFAPALGGLAVSVVVVVTLAAWLMLDGVATLTMSFQQKKEGLAGWGWGVFGGIVSILAGILALVFPLSTGLFLGIMFLWVMAIGLLVRGILALGGRALGGWGIALGVLDILIAVWFAVALFTDPAGMILAMLWVAGVYGVIFGIVSIVWAFKVRRV